MRRLTLVEPALFFLLLMGYIWLFRFGHPRWWIGLLAYLLISHALHREGPRDLGFGRRSLLECADVFAPLLAILALFLIAGGLLLGTTRDIPFDRAFLALAAYLPWGVVQQYLINGYMLNRFEGALGTPAASCAAAALFAVAHTPNWFLMAVALVGGWCGTLVYRRHRNLYFLGIAHAIIGFLLYVTVPDSISHHLNVGPGLMREWRAHRLVQ